MIVLNGYCKYNYAHNLRLQVNFETCLQRFSIKIITGQYIDF